MQSKLPVGGGKKFILYPMNRMFLFIFELLFTSYIFCC